MKNFTKVLLLLITLAYPLFLPIIYILKTGELPLYCAAAANFSNVWAVWITIIIVLALIIISQLTLTLCVDVWDYIVCLQFFVVYIVFFLIFPGFTIYEVHNVILYYIMRMLIPISSYVWQYYFTNKRIAVIQFLFCMFFAILGEIIGQPWWLLSDVIIKGIPPAGLVQILWHIGERR